MCVAEADLYAGSAVLLAEKLNNLQRMFDQMYHATQIKCYEFLKDWGGPVKPPKHKVMRNVWRGGEEKWDNTSVLIEEADSLCMLAVLCCWPRT